MLFKDALRQDGSIVASGMSWNAMRTFSNSIMGEHSMHVSSPTRFQLNFTGQLLSGMSTLVACHDNECGVDLRTSIDRKQLAGIYFLCLPVSGEQEMRSLRSSVLSHKDRGVVLSPEQPVELITAGNCRKIVVAIRRSAVEQTLSDVLGRRLDDVLIFSESMDAVDGPGATWWRTVKHHLAEIQRSRELYGCGYFSQPIETALIRGLLVSQPSNYSEQIKQALGTRIPAYVARAISFIEANYRETIHLEDIEAATGISRLKLFKSFRKHTSFTPTAYLKDYRLRQARAQLQQDRSDQNVSCVALGVGFNHLGRFAIDYKRAFSETPSETIRRNTRSS